MKVREIISNNYNDFTKSEKIVADFYLSNPTDAYVFRLCDISEILHVGEATIIRFVKKCGYSSYTNFQYDFSNDLSESNIPKTNTDDFLDNSLMEIRTLVRNINIEPIKNAASLIDQAEFVACIGITYSEIAAKFCALDFKMAGKNAGIYSSTNEITNIFRISPKNSVFIIFSRLGETNEIINGLSIANRNNIKVIGITKPHSHIANESDIVIDCSHSKNKYDMSFSTYVTTMNQMMISREILNEYQRIDYSSRHKLLLNSHKALMQASGTLRTTDKDKEKK